MVDPVVRLCFRFIRLSMIGLAVGLGVIEGLAIGGAISTRADVAVGFFGLSLW